MVARTVADGQGKGKQALPGKGKPGLAAKGKPALPGNKGIQSLQGMGNQPFPCPCRERETSPFREWGNPALAENGKPALRGNNGSEPMQNDRCTFSVSF